MDEKHSYSEVWRRFEQHPLTHSMAHYLLSIAELKEERGYVRSTDVAKRLGVTKGSASIALRTIRERGLIAEDENRMILLTEAGVDAVESIVGARSTFLEFFRDILGIDENIALEDACKLEHLVSRATSERLARFMRFLLIDQPVREHVDQFRAQVNECGSVKECPRCGSLDECAEHLVEETISRTAASGARRRSRTAKKQ